MEKQEIWQAIEKEAQKDKKLNPRWPDTIVAKSALVSCAAGQLSKSSIELKYHKRSSVEAIKVQHENIKEDAVNVIVNALRFLENLKD